AERAGRVLSRERLLELGRGSAEEAFDRSIDVHISRLRAKLGDDPRRPRLLKTVRGAGYQLASGPARAARAGARSIAVSTCTASCCCWGSPRRGAWRASCWAATRCAAAPAAWRSTARGYSPRSRRKRSQARLRAWATS